MKIYGKEIKNSNIIIVILIVIILVLAKCSGDRINKLESENIIEKNNIEVLNDSIHNYKNSKGELIQERGVLIADKKSLKSLNKELYDKVVDLENSISNMKPMVVVKYKTKIQTDTIYLNSSLVELNDSTYIIHFNKDTVYNKNNSRQLEGSLTLELSKDSSTFNKIKVNNINLSKDIINMDATLVLGMKDGKLKVWLQTDYPGFAADKIDAVTLDPNIHPELRKLNNRKRFSVGPYIGISAGFSNQKIIISPNIGIGIQYSLFKF